MADSVSWALSGAIQRARAVKSGRMTGAQSGATLDLIRFCARKQCRPAEGGFLSRRGFVVGNHGVFVGDDGRWWMFADRVVSPGGLSFPGLSRALTAAIGAGSDEVDRVGRQMVVSNRFVASLPRGNKWLVAFMTDVFMQMPGARRRFGV